MTLLVALTLCAVVLWRLSRRNHGAVSQRWLSAFNRRSTRVEFHGVHVHRRWRE